MKKINDQECVCALCEYGQEIFDGEYCICKIKGVTSPTAHCRRFCFDPLKMKVCVRKIPEFHAPADFNIK